MKVAHGGNGSEISENVHRVLPTELHLIFQLAPASRITLFNFLNTFSDIFITHTLHGYPLSPPEQNGGHSIAPKTTSANAASASL